MPRDIVSSTLRQGLYTKVVGRRILYYRSLESTMDEAARLAKESDDDGIVVVAEEQTAARGRFQRQWISQPGNLYLSVVLRPSAWGLQYVSIMAGLAVARAIRKSTGLQPTLKWPNDIRLDGKKVCGVLVESSVAAGVVDYAVVGIGLNVALKPGDFPEIADIATSVNQALDAEADRTELLGSLLHELDRLYMPLRREASSGEEELAPALLEWKGRLDTLGRRVRVQWKDEVYHGMAEDVDSVGNLKLRTDSGDVVTLLAGEVTSQVDIAEPIG